MKSFLSVIIPVAAGVLLVFFGIPKFGGDLDFLVQKIAIDWEISNFAMRLILSIASALVLTILFQLLKRIALWLAILVVLAAIFSPTLLSNTAFVSDSVKNYIQEKIENHNSQD